MGEITQTSTTSGITEGRDLLRFITAGSVDDGKSTLIGRLLYDTKTIFEDQLEHVEDVSKRRGDERTNLALLTDGLRAEREQGITIDVAYRYFSTPRRKFIIADAPGHIQYTRNMVTGASTANLAIVLVDARKGLVEQSRRHAFLASLLGIPHIVVAVNKMDLVDYSEEVFEKIKAEMTDWSAKLQVRDITFIPISALGGDNVVEKSERMPWYRGTPLLYHLETVHIASDRNLIDVRLPVQWVIRPQSEKLSDYRGYAGVVAGGTMKPGDEVVVLPSRFLSKIARIETHDGPVEEAFPPMAVTLHLEDDVDISRGDMLCRPSNEPTVGEELDAMVAWMSNRPLEVRNRYALKHTTRWLRAVVTELQYELNVNTLHRNQQAKSLGLNGIGRVRLHTTVPIFYDPYERNRTTGAFILVDETTNETVGAGMLLAPSSHDAQFPPITTGGVWRYGHTTNTVYSGIFVTGTDTGVGKTLVSCTLLHGLAEAGVRVVGMKPVASCCEETADGLRNEDALALQRYGVAAPYELINPFAYEPPIAPHLAAEAVGRPISLGRIEQCYRELTARADLVLVEGAGGWRVPLNGELTLAEIARRLQLGVVLVVGIRLGCLSHALLTQEAIRADGLPLLGWVANCIEPVDVNNTAQIDTLRSRIQAPLLGVLPYQLSAAPESLAPRLDIRRLRLERQILKEV